MYTAVGVWRRTGSRLVVMLFVCDPRQRRQPFRRVTTAGFLPFLITLIRVNWRDVGEMLAAGVIGRDLGRVGVTT